MISVQKSIKAGTSGEAGTELFIIAITIGQ
jgi:hypothetical protein